MEPNKATTSVFQKLLEVQTKLKAPKSQFNKFGGFSFRNCEDIMEAVKPHLKEVGAVIVLSDNIQVIGGRFYVEALAHFIDIETSNKITNKAFAREEDTKKGMDGSQVTGAASSYARKYALNGLLAIDDTKDADTPTESQELNKALLEEANELKIDLSNVATYLKKQVAAITNEDLKKCIEQKKKALGAQQ